MRKLWTERDPRVPLHRRIGADGHPTLADIQATISDRDPSGSCLRSNARSRVT